MMTVQTSSLDALTFDGNDLWFSDTSEKKIKKVSIAQQRVLNEIKFLPGGIPKAMTFANDTLVVVNYDPATELSSELIQINVMNGKTIRTLACPENLDTGLIFDNTYFWGCSRKLKEIYKFHPATGEIEAVIPIKHPIRSIAWNGENIIVAYQPDESKKVSIIGILDTPSQKFLKELAVEVEITGMTFAEDMIFYTIHDLSEIQVTRVKV
jgi:hypothetical protein